MKTLKCFQYTYFVFTVLTAAYDRLYVVCMSLPPLLLSLHSKLVSGRRENRSFITTEAAAVATAAAAAEKKL